MHCSQLLPFFGHIYYLNNCASNIWRDKQSLSSNGSKLLIQVAPVKHLILSCQLCVRVAVFI